MTLLRSCARGDETATTNGSTPRGAPPPALQHHHHRHPCDATLQSFLIKFLIVGPASNSPTGSLPVSEPNGVFRSSSLSSDENVSFSSTSRGAWSEREEADHG